MAISLSCLRTSQWQRPEPCQEHGGQSNLRVMTRSPCFGVIVLPAWHGKAVLLRFGRINQVAVLYLDNTVDNEGHTSNQLFVVNEPKIGYLKKVGHRTQTPFISDFIDYIDELLRDSREKVGDGLVASIMELRDDSVAQIEERMGHVARFNNAQIRIQQLKGVRRVIALDFEEK